MQYCTACQKAIATIVIMDVREGNVTGQQHLCAACAETMGVVQSKTQLKLSTEILEDLLGGLKGKSPSDKRERGRREHACRGCRMTIADFKVKGRLGCPRCYETFHDELVPLLQRVHEATSHRGRMPSRTATIEGGAPDALADLRRRLDDAIRNERYEDAARLRDELRKAESATGPGARS